MAQFVRIKAWQADEPRMHVRRAQTMEKSNLEMNRMKMEHCTGKVINASSICLFVILRCIPRCDSPNADGELAVDHLGCKASSVGNRTILTSDGRHLTNFICRTHRAGITTSGKLENATAE